jgi:hypothetical protein
MYYYLILSILYLLQRRLCPLYSCGSNHMSTCYLLFFACHHTYDNMTLIVDIQFSGTSRSLVLYYSYMVFSLFVLVILCCFLVILCCFFVLVISAVPVVLYCFLVIKLQVRHQLEEQCHL